jgi:hypothetical protein
MYLSFWTGAIMGKDHMEELGIDGKIILNWFYLQTLGSRLWNELMWLRVGTGGRFFPTWYRTFRFISMQWIS